MESNKKSSKKDKEKNFQKLISQLPMNSADFSVVKNHLEKLKETCQDLPSHCCEDLHLYNLMRILYTGYWSVDIQNLCMELNLMILIQKDKSQIEGPLKNFVTQFISILCQFTLSPFQIQRQKALECLIQIKQKHHIFNDEILTKELFSEWRTASIRDDSPQCRILFLELLKCFIEGKSPPFIHKNDLFVPICCGILDHDRLVRAKAVQLVGETDFSAVKNIFWLHLFTKKPQEQEVSPPKAAPKQVKNKKKEKNKKKKQEKEEKQNGNSNENFDLFQAEGDFVLDHKFNGFDNEYYGMFILGIEDEYEIVRKNTLLAIRQLFQKVTHMKNETLNKKFKNGFLSISHLIHDEMDSIRILALEILLEMAPVYPFDDDLLILIRACLLDPKKEIRQNALKCLSHSDHEKVGFKSLQLTMQAFHQCHSKFPQDKTAVWLAFKQLGHTSRKLVKKHVRSFITLETNDVKAPEKSLMDFESKFTSIMKDVCLHAILEHQPKDDFPQIWKKQRKIILFAYPSFFEKQDGNQYYLELPSIYQKFKHLPSLFEQLKQTELEKVKFIDLAQLSAFSLYLEACFHFEAAATRKLYDFCRLLWHLKKSPDSEESKLIHHLLRKLFNLEMYDSDYQLQLKEKIKGFQIDWLQWQNFSCHPLVTSFCSLSILHPDLNPKKKNDMPGLYESNPFKLKKGFPLSLNIQADFKVFYAMKPHLLFLLRVRFQQEQQIKDKYLPIEIPFEQLQLTVTTEQLDFTGSFRVSVELLVGMELKDQQYLTKILSKLDHYLIYNHAFYVPIPKYRLSSILFLHCLE